MIICAEGGLRRAGRLAFAQFVVVSCGCTDLRWALATLALQSLSVAGAYCRVSLVILARNAARRVARAGFPAFAVRLGSDRGPSQDPLRPRHRSC